MLLCEKPRIELILGDCMDLLHNTPSKHYDLAIVDPPYGINISEDLYERGQNCVKNGYRAWEYKDWDKKSPTKEYLKQLFTASKNQIIWGGNYFELPPKRCWLVWDKGQRDFSFADGELAWTSFDKSVRIFNYSRALLLKENKIHPTQKPIALYRWLLKNYAKNGDKILDTHAGSFSSGIACWEMGFDITAIELDVDYFNAAINRFKNYIKQQRLF